MRSKPTAKKPELKGGLMPLSKIRTLVKKAKSKGLTVVTTNGCFDILHLGHIRYLSWAKRQGDLLIVGVNSDASVRRLKGPKRPLNAARERAELVAALKPVDAVFIFNETTPTIWLKVLKPHLHVKGADRAMREIIEKRVVEQGGGRILLAPYIKDRSTTTIVKKTASASRDMELRC